MKPSDIKNIKPMASIFGKSEYETIAQNIIKILARTGDEFRALEWEEYRLERLKDSNFSMLEKPYFDKVLPYTMNAKHAAGFCKAWDIK